MSEISIPPTQTVSSQQELEQAHTELLRNYKELINTARIAFEEKSHTELENAELKKENSRLKKENSQKDKIIEERSKRSDSLFMELQWIRKVHYNPTFRPVEKDVIITAHDHARKGEPTRLFVGTKAQQTGMARNTYGGTLQKLNDFGVLAWEVGEGQKTEKGFAREGVLTFPEQLLKNPDEIVIDRGPENRGGNAKEKARLKSCPECNSIQLEEGKICYCKNCNHQWEEGKRKDINVITPQDEMREAANKTTVTKSVNVAGIPQEPDWLKEEMHAEELHQHMDDLFPTDQLSIMTDNSTVPNLGQLEPPEETGDTSHLDYDAACQLLNELTESSAHIEWLPDGKRMLYAPKSTVWEQQQWRKRIVALGAELKDLCEVQV